MSGSSQATKLVAGPVTTTVVRASLVHLGWRVDFADEQSIVADLNTKGIGHQEFSVSVTWQAQLNNVLVSARVVKKTSGERSESACETQVKKILEAIGQTCGEAEQPKHTGKRWTGSVEF